MRSILAFPALLLAACQSVPAKAQTPQTEELLAELPALIETQLEAWHVPGLAVGIVKDGEVLFTGAFGYRDREARLPVTTRTLFPIASCSKAFTALGAAIAADEGLVDWDRPIREYVPEFEMMDPEATRKATLGDFLRHRSGFGEHRFLPRLTGASREEVFRRLRYLEPEGKFREKLVYSNLGYAMAGYLVGTAADTSWEAFTRERIFEPLGMASTGFAVEEMEESGDFAIGYLNLLDFDRPDRVGVGNLTALAPAGGIVSNLEDMVKWLQFNLGDGKMDDLGKGDADARHLVSGDGHAEARRLVSAERLAALHRPHTDLSSDPDGELITYQGYGYGWWTETYRGFRHVHHGGLGDGYISQVSFIPEEGIGVVVLTNDYYAHLHQALIYHVFDQLLGLPEVDHFQRELSGLTGYMANWVKEYNAFFDEEPGKPGPTLALEGYTGKYDNPAWGAVSVALQDGGLHLTFRSGIQNSLRHCDGDTFATDEMGIGLLHRPVRFEVGNDGRVEAFTMELESGVAPIRFVR
jgi:CubicO group peptidase (beta-lactamase class C family)